MLSAGVTPPTAHAITGPQADDSASRADATSAGLALAKSRTDETTDAAFGRIVHVMFTS
ncbi:hypothetical protein [Streptomyces sp. NPDC054804]